MALLAARKEVIRRVQAQFPYLSPAEINGRLVAYCSDQAHSSVEKACLIGLVKLNLVPSDDKLRLRGNALRQAIAKDKENGLIPFYVSKIIIEFVYFKLKVLALCNIGYNWSMCL